MTSIYFQSYQLTLNTSSPDLTRCFLNTACLWTTCGFLWIMCIFYLPYLLCKPWLHQWNNFSHQQNIKLVNSHLLYNLYNHYQHFWQLHQKYNFALCAIYLLSHCQKVILFKSFHTINIKLLHRYNL